MHVLKIDQLLLKPKTGSAHSRGIDGTAQIRIIKTLRDCKKELTVTEIAKDIKGSKSNVIAAVAYLVRTHRIIKVGSKKPFRYSA